MSNIKSQISNNQIVILHGWGLCGEKYAKLKELLESKKYKVYSPDMPGFASEPLKGDSMNLDDYVEFVDSFMKKNKIEKPVLIGHSFGGRVALKYAWKYPEKVKKIVLTGTPILRNKSLTRKIFFVLATGGGYFFKRMPSVFQDFSRKALYSVIGEWDYYKSGPLKQTFKNIIGEGLVNYYKEVKNPIMLVWGKEDKIVPAIDYEKNQKLFPKTKFITVANADHKLPYKNPEIFFSGIKDFI